MTPDKLNELAEPTPTVATDEVERLRSISRDMLYAVGGGMSWIDHSEAVAFTGRIDRVADDLARAAISSTRMEIEAGRSAANAASGHSAEPEPSCTVSAVPASVPNADDWYYTSGEIPSIGRGAVIFALGRYGDIFGPLPFEMFAEEAWQGNMLGAACDLVAFGFCYEEWRDIFSYQPRDPSVYGKRATTAIAMEARQGRNREDGSDPKDDSAGPQDIAQ